MRGVETLRQFAHTLRLSEKTIHGLALALEESASNIVNHALRRDARQTFRVAFEFTGGAMVIELRDRGPVFDPTQSRESGPTADDDDRPPGGWGIQLVRRYTDEIRYAREDGENVLRLTKRMPLKAVNDPRTKQQKTKTQN